MGFLDKVFGKKEEVAPLADDHEAMSRLRQDMKGLEILAGDVTDRIEVVPAAKASYVFIGKPPKMFGLAWVDGGTVRDFKTLGKEKGMTSLDLKPVMDRIKSAYENHPPGERFGLKVGDREILVAPESGLAAEVEQAIQAASS